MFLPTSVIARDLEHLYTLVTEAIKAIGLEADLNHIDVSRVESMDGLFSRFRKSFQGDISRWDVSNVTSMIEMFYGASFNGDISKWNTSKVKLMTCMFEKSAFVGDISNWNTTHVESFNRMFLNAKFAGDISEWTFTPLRGMAQISHMFADSQIDKIEVPNVYCWAYAITAPNQFPFPLRPEWQQHLKPLLAPLLSLELSILDAAALVHQAWQGRHLSLESIALPALD